MTKINKKLKFLKFILKSFLWNKAIKNNDIIGTILKEYSISCFPKEIIEVKFSLKYFWSASKKKDKKKFFKYPKKELNSVGGYSLGKLDNKNKLETILDREIKNPNNKEVKKFKKICKVFWKCA